MMQLPFELDLKGKVAVVTGGGGVLCGMMAKAIAASGAKVAILDLRAENAQKVADEITADGGQAIGIAANVLEIESLKAAEKVIVEKFGVCDILINGAGGNHPKGTTSKEYLEKVDLAGAVEGVTTFFDLDPQGVSFVFNLNFLGTLLPTQVFARGMAEKGNGCIVNIGALVDHDTVLEEGVHLAPGAIVKALNRIPAGSKIESGVVIQNGEFPL